MRKRQPEQLLTTVRAAQEADIPHILNLDKFPLSKSPTAQSEQSLRDWITRSPGSVLVLMEQKSKQIWGRAYCIPLSSEVVRELRNHSPLDNSLISRFLLRPHEAEAQTSGNTLFVGMFVINPRTRKEEYGSFASPLFDELGAKFNQLRVAAVVGRSYTTAASEVWRNRVGGTQLSQKGNSIVWLCDHKIGRGIPGSGLATVFATIWPPSQERIFGYTGRECQVMDGLIRHPEFKDKQLAEHLKMELNTFRTHIGNIIDKADPQKSGCKAFGCRPSRGQLVDYCRTHSWEYRIPGT
jgi:hypothetical protein